MTTTPVLTGRDIAEAAGAVQAMLEASVADTGLAADDYIALSVLHVGPPMTPSAFAAFLLSQRQLRLDAGRATARVAGLAAAGLVEPLRDDAPVTPTARGGEVHREHLARVQGLVERLYGGMDADELAVAKHVLAEVGERARMLAAELAA